jgi:hypothetical protein
LLTDRDIVVSQADVATNLPDDQTGALVEAISAAP